MDGIILVNKEKNMTSRDVVNIVSKKLGTKKVGHSGTLDPLATGVLVLGVNKYTKVLPLLDNMDKEYVAEVLVGKSYDTLDITGNLIEEKEINDLDKEKLDKVILSFKKTYLQEIPLYSAKKINGKKLYEYAREGKEVELPKKEVSIYDIKLLDVYKKENEYYFKIYCKVSKGTFIRSLINDISKEMNIPMSMSNLERIKVGNFDIKDSNELDDEEYKYYHIEDIFDYPVYELDDEMYFRVKNGVSLPSDNYGDIVLFKYNGEEIAIYKKENNMMKVLLMLK